MKFIASLLSVTAMTTALAASEPKNPVDIAKELIKASQYPDLDPARACGYLTDKFRNVLVERWNSTPQIKALGMTVSSCEEAITKQASLQAAAKNSERILTQTHIELLRQQANQATVLVKYPSGKCGTFVFEPRGSSWAMNEQSEEGCK
jgi:hypothetical protein